MFSVCDTTADNSQLCYNSRTHFYICCLCNANQSSSHYQDEYTFLSHLTLHHRVCRLFDKLLQLSVVHNNADTSLRSVSIGEMCSPAGDQSAVLQTENLPEQSQEESTIKTESYVTMFNLVANDLSGLEQSVENNPSLPGLNINKKVGSYPTESYCPADWKSPTTRKRHSCSMCSKVFLHHHQLKRHVMNNHTGEKPHRCSTCSKTFAQNSHLKRHQLIHLNVKPHQCPVCGKSFLHNHNMKCHIKVHTGEKPHRCPICHKAFLRNCDLKRHMVIHNRRHTLPPNGVAAHTNKDLYSQNGGSTDVYNNELT